MSVIMLNLLRQPLIRIAQSGVKNFGKSIPRGLVRSDSYSEYLRVKNAGRLNYHPFEIPKIPNWVKNTIGLGFYGGLFSLSGMFWYNVFMIMMGESDD